MYSTDKMSLAEKVGQMLSYGGATGGLGQQGQWTVEQMKQGLVGGVYMGYPHFRDPSQLREVITSFQQVNPISLFIGMDFESGPAYNIASGCEDFPWPMGIGQIGSEEIAYRQGEIIGRQSAAMGVNFIYAPCVDVNLRFDNPIIGIRSFSSDVHVVMKMATAFIKGCQKSGVICTAKHFPGGGDSTVDAHVDLSYTRKTLQQLEQLELLPYYSAIEAKVGSIMICHEVYPEIDTAELPATLSGKIQTDLLRKKMKFDGLIISDSLSMGAIRKHFEPVESYIMAIEAGCDVLLLPPNPHALPGIVKAIEAGRISEERINESVARILKAKNHFREKQSTEQCIIKAEEEEFALEIGRKAVTVLKNEGVFPLPPDKSRLYVIQWRPDEAEYFPREAGILSRLMHEIRLQNNGPENPVFATVSKDCLLQQAEGILSKAKDVEMVVFLAIVKNYSCDPQKGLFSGKTVEMINLLTNSCKKTILAILGSPYVLDQIPDVAGYLCSYGDNNGAVEGIMQKLFNDKD